MEAIITKARLAYLEKRRTEDIEKLGGPKTKVKPEDPLSLDDPKKLEGLKTKVKPEKPPSLLATAQTTDASLSPPNTIITDVPLDPTTEAAKHMLKIVHALANETRPDNDDCLALEAYINLDPNFKSVAAEAGIIIPDEPDPDRAPASAPIPGTDFVDHGSTTH